MCTQKANKYFVFRVMHFLMSCVGRKLPKFLYSIKKYEGQKQHKSIKERNLSIYFIYLRTYFAFKQCFKVMCTMTALL